MKNIKKMIAAAAASVMMTLSLAPSTGAVVWFTPENSKTVYALEDDCQTPVKSGWLHDGDDTYYIKKDGSVKTGWLTLKSGTKYYFGKDGKMYKSKFVKDKKGNRYYLLDNGKMATGTVTIGSKTYKFSSKGVLKSTTTAKAEDKAIDKNEKPIYATKSGKCWHYDNHCNNAKYHEITKEEAEKLKLKPCEKCVGK